MYRVRVECVKDLQFGLGGIAYIGDLHEFPLRGCSSSSLACQFSNYLGTTWWVANIRGESLDVAETLEDTVHVTSVTKVTNSSQPDAL